MDESSLGYSWHEWHIDWTPEEAGHYTVVVRAVDEAGNLQPLETHCYSINGIKPVCIDVV
jgi:hypothetical protein